MSYDDSEPETTGSDLGGASPSTSEKHEVVPPQKNILYIDYVIKNIF